MWCLITGIALTIGAACSIILHRIISEVESRPPCPYCDSKNIARLGSEKPGKLRWTHYRCQDCGHQWSHSKRKRK